MERGLSVLARTALQVALAGVVLARAPSAEAAPKTPAAKAAFQRGVKAYQQKQWAEASAALAHSYALEADVETLFAWAQAERHQNNCEKALDLYAILLAGELPDANRKAIREARAECAAILAAEKPADPPPADDPPPEPPPARDPEPRVVAPVPERPPPSSPEGRSRWTDPLGLALVLSGAVGLGVGGYLLVDARGAAADADAASNYFDAEALDARAVSRGRAGVIAGVAGGVLLVGGLVRIATVDTRPRAVVSGWLAPGGGGLAVLGRF